jgi:DNA-binding NarL/FixJ family response regulator
MSRRTSVVVVDDHPVVRDGLAFLLGEQPDFEVLGEAADAASALALLREALPDVLVLDLSLQGRDAIPLIGQLHREFPALRILVLSMHDEELYAERLLGLGAHGYVMKQEEPAEFLRALRRVAAGEVHLSAAMTARLVDRVARGGRGGGRVAVQLTTREQDVLRRVARGLGTREIAAELGMSAKTVDSHRRNIREKLGLASSRDLVRYAVRWAGGTAQEGP